MVNVMVVMCVWRGDLLFEFKAICEEVIFLAMGSRKYLTILESKMNVK